MNTYAAFTQLFGSITILDLVTCIGALVFLWAMYEKVSGKITAKHDADQERDAKINEAYDGVHNRYPEYRKQSIEIQEKLESQMDALAKALDNVTQRLAKMEDDDNRRERSKLRDLLLQNFRYYTSKEKNPSQAWTHVESETFWELYKEYEASGGNGYMHTDVVPAMQRLEIVDEIDR